MELLKHFLNRFSNLTLPDNSLKRIFIEILATDYKIEIKRDWLNVKQKVLIINTSPIIKSEIFMNKHKILTKLNNLLGSKAPHDIR